MLLACWCLAAVYYAVEEQKYVKILFVGIDNANSLQLCNCSALKNNFFP